MCSDKTLNYDFAKLSHYNMNVQANSTKNEQDEHYA